MALTNGQTRETLANDMWQACKILRRDNNCGGVMEYIEHLAWLLFLRFLDAQEDIWQTEALLTPLQKGYDKTHPNSTLRKWRKI